MDTAFEWISRLRIVCAFSGIIYRGSMLPLCAFDFLINFLMMFIIVYTLSLTLRFYYTWNIRVKLWFNLVWMVGWALAQRTTTVGSRLNLLVKDEFNEHNKYFDNVSHVNAVGTGSLRR